VHSPQNIEAIRVACAKKSGKINPEGCSRIMNIQTISAVKFAATCVCIRKNLWWCMNSLLVINNGDWSLVCGQSIKKSQRMMNGFQIRHIFTQMASQAKCVLLGFRKSTYGHQENASHTEN
jgi:hypothetical protein